MKNKYRVIKDSNIWTDKEHYYPEERPWWWPFWFRFESNGYQVFFDSEDQCWLFIKQIKNKR
jgi:hypothetical protein